MKTTLYTCRKDPLLTDLHSTCKIEDCKIHVMNHSSSSLGKVRSGECLRNRCSKGLWQRHMAGQPRSSEVGSSQAALQAAFSWAMCMQSANLISIPFKLNQSTYETDPSHGCSIQFSWKCHASNDLPISQPISSTERVWCNQRHHCKNMSVRNFNHKSERKFQNMLFVFNWWNTVSNRFLRSSILFFPHISAQYHPS